MREAAFKLVASAAILLGSLKYGLQLEARIEEWIKSRRSRKEGRGSNSVSTTANHHGGEND